MAQNSRRGGLLEIATPSVPNPTQVAYVLTIRQVSEKQPTGAYEREPDQ